MNYNYEIRHLSNIFKIEYPENLYPEFENKAKRPFVVFLVEIDNHIFAIPFRTNMNHKYGFKFSESNLNTRSSTGLDFTKAVLVDNTKLLGEKVRIDSKEFKKLNKKCLFIKNQFEKYYYNYKKYVKGELNNKLSEAYKYSTLKYFHKELDIK